MHIIHRTILDRNKAVLRAFQLEQTAYKNSVQTKMKRQLQIVDPAIADEDAEALSRDPEACRDRIQQMVQGQPHRKIVSSVNDIQNKYQDILQLERSVNEVVTLFEELAILIQAQGEMLDSIEANL